MLDTGTIVVESVGRGAKLHIHGHVLAVPNDLEVDRLTRRVIAHHALQLADAIHRLAICRDDHVAFLDSREPCRIRGVVRVEALDEHAGDLIELGDRRSVSIDVGDRNTQARRSERGRAG